MSKVMFGWKWSNGTWRDGPEHPKKPDAPIPRKPKEWRRTGFFTRGLMAAYHAAKSRNSTSFFYREWLRVELRQPTPAREIYRRAADAQIPVSGLKRAKKHCGVITTKVGGGYQGWGAQWVWRLPVSKLQGRR